MLLLYGSLILNILLRNFVIFWYFKISGSILHDMNSDWYLSCELILRLDMKIYFTLGQAESLNKGSKLGLCCPRANIIKHFSYEICLCSY
jgi:hypothetical protein